MFFFCNKTISVYSTGNYIIIQRAVCMPDYVFSIIIVILNGCLCIAHEEVMLAAGGRYDEMVEKIRPGCHIPCVGLSVLIERIFKHMNEREHLNLESVRKMQTKVLVASDQGRLKERMELCAGLWEANIQVQ